MVILVLIFWEASILFSRAAAPIYIPNSAWQFPFLHVLASIYLLSFDDSHSDSSELMSYCDFDLRLLD